MSKVSSLLSSDWDPERANHKRPLDTCRKSLVHLSPPSCACSQITRQQLDQVHLSPMSGLLPPLHSLELHVQSAEDFSFSICDPQKAERKEAEVKSTMSVPLYAPTPIQPAHPTPFYIKDILGRTGTPSSTSASSTPTQSPVIPTPTLPSPNSSFTTFISPYRTPVYEPTPIHPALSHHAAAALTATYASAGAFAGSVYHPLHPQQPHRAMGEYAQALLRHDPLGECVE